jgi:hypothetical protein
MSAFGTEGFASVATVEVELYTAAYRVSGEVHTPFRRVAEILNLLSGAHLTIESASIMEHAAPDVIARASSAIVTVDDILVLIAADLATDGRAEMRIQKQAARVRMAIPPLRLDGAIHVPVGSRPVDGLLNVPDRYLPMTDVTLSSAVYPSIDREVPILAVRRNGAHVVTFVEAGDDETTEEEEGSGWPEGAQAAEGAAEG